MKSRHVLGGGVLLLLLVVLLATPAHSQRGQAVYSVSGHAVWDLIAGTPEADAQFIDQISINAWVDDAGEAHGTITWTSVFHNVPADPEDPDYPPGPGSSGYPWHMDVTYLDVEGNVAYVWAEVVSSPQFPDDVGELAFFKIEDKGNGAPDPSDTINNDDLVAGNLIVVEGAPEGYTFGPPFSGNCAHRPPDSTCVHYDDNYIWLVYDSISGWRYEGDWQGLPIQVAMGYSGEYFHILGTDYVKYEPY